MERSGGQRRRGWTARLLRRLRWRRLTGLRSRRRWQEVCAAARVMLAADPDDRAARHALAQAYARIGFDRDAVTELERLRGGPTHRRSVLLRLGEIHGRHRRHAEARSAWLELLDEPGDEEGRPLLLERIADTHAAEHDPAAARAVLLAAREQLRARPATRSSTIHGWVRIERRLGNAGRPAEVLRAAITGHRWTLAPKPRWIAGLAELELLEGECLRWAETVAREHPDDRLWFVPAHRMLGEGRVDEARAALEAAAHRGDDPTWTRLRALVEARTPAPATLSTAALTGARSAPAGLAVVACHFNPCGYRSLRRNHEEFRRRLEPSGVRVLSVELAFDDRPFELEGDDVLRLRGRDVLWHKERLLNLGIERLLDAGHDKIVWADADIVFEEPDWADRVDAALDDAVLCQVFDRALMRRDVYCAGVYHPSFVAQALAGFRAASHPITGFAWGARAELLRAVPLHDTAVLGSGDLYMAFGSWEDARRPPLVDMRLTRVLGRMPPALRADYDAWRARWSAAVGGRIGRVAQPLQTLYHGSRENRGYRVRLSTLVEHDFRPDEDIERDEAGVWRWASDKPALHAAVRDYFGRRDEDEAAGHVVGGAPGPGALAGGSAR